LCSSELGMEEEVCREDWKSSSSSSSVP